MARVALWMAGLDARRARPLDLPVRATSSAHDCDRVVRRGRRGVREPFG